MAASFSSARDGVIRPLSTDVSIFDSITPNLKIFFEEKTTPVTNVTSIKSSQA
jgi:hypothetical protein